MTWLSRRNEREWTQNIDWIQSEVSILCEALVSVASWFGLVQLSDTYHVQRGVIEWKYGLIEQVCLSQRGNAEVDADWLNGVQLQVEAAASGNVHSEERAWISRWTMATEATETETAMRRWLRMWLCLCCIL